MIERTNPGSSHDPAVAGPPDLAGDDIALLWAEVARLRGEQAVRKVVTRYFRLCDTLGPSTSMEELGGCFTREAAWEGRGLYRAAFGRHQGREAIVAMLARYAVPHPHFAMNAHFLTSEDIAVDRDGGATGRWTMLQASTYHNGRSDLRSAALTIRCAVEEGEWRIAHFVTEALFARAVDHWSDAEPISTPDTSPKESQ